MYNDDISRIVFRGTNPGECEDFISAIRGKALAEGKHRDNQWIAYFVSSCFAGDPLYWYEGLDEGIQEDWKLLRLALLERFGQRHQAPTSPSSPSTIPSSAAFGTIPALPAAGPSSTLGSVPRKGRLKIFNHFSGQFRGYLAAVITHFGLCHQVQEKSEGALIVEIQSNLTEEAQEIRIYGGNYLAATWTFTTDSSWAKESSWYSSISPVACCSWPRTTSTTKWPTAKRVWVVSGDNEVFVRYPTPGGDELFLRPYIACVGGELRWLGDSHQGYGFEEVKVVFEEIV